MTPISVLTVVGAGFMSARIAECAAVAGKHVLLYEPESAPLDRARGRLEASVAWAVDRGKLT
jgi:3-hydroxybutyryl-CoA dehydrogenase